MTLTTFRKGVRTLLSLAWDLWPLVKSVELMVRGFRPPVSSSLSGSLVVSITTPNAGTG